MASGVLRIVIIVVAGFLIWQFSDGFLLAWETLADPTEAQWFNVLSALGEGLLGPVLALSAIALAATNRRLFLAAILAVLAAVVYVAPFAAFFIASMAGLVYLANVPSLGPPLLAQLNAESGQASFVAAVNKEGDTLTIVPAALLAGDQQKAFELWLIPPGDKPHSLGLIDPKKPVRITVPESLLPQVNRDAVLAVSLEPPGGSPTGQPTGPVIANGKLASL